MNTMDPTGLRQRLSFELQGLHNRDLEQQCIGSIRTLLHGVRGGSLFRVAVCELLSELDSCPRSAIKLRLQLAEYCVLKCASKAQLYKLLPMVMKQAQTILACRLDASCISSLAAFLSSALAKVLQDTPAGNNLPLQCPSEVLSPLYMDDVYNVMLVPVIQSTYRNPEQSRVSAGSVVLSGMMEVLKACIGRSSEVQIAINRCLVLMVQLLGQGSLVLRVPGVLDPVCVCMEAVGDRICYKVAKRLLHLCLKAAAAKEVWQVRRDCIRTIETLVTALHENTEVSLPDDQDSLATKQLDVCDTALGVLIRHKHMVLQLLEGARYDKFAAVRMAAATAHVKVLKLPDPEVPSADTSAIIVTAPGKRKLWGNVSRTGTSGTAESALAGARKSSYRRPGFSRPKYPPGTVLDYGVQVFAPPSPPKHHTAPVSGADISSADPSPVRRQLDFNTPDKEAMLSRENKLADFSSQTTQDDLGYSVRSPACALRVARDACGLTEGGGTVCGPARTAAGTGLQLLPNDTQLPLDQTHHCGGVSAVLASAAGSPARLDISHHVHGRVEVGIVYSPVGSPLSGDTAAALTAAALGAFHAPTAHCAEGHAAPNIVHDGSAAERGSALPERVRPQQQVSGLQQQAPETPAAAFRCQLKIDNVVQQQQCGSGQRADTGVPTAEPSFSTALLQHSTDVLAQDNVSEPERVMATSSCQEFEQQNVEQRQQRVNSSSLSEVPYDKVPPSNPGDWQQQMVSVDATGPAVSLPGQNQLCDPEHLHLLHGHPLMIRQHQHPCNGEVQPMRSSIEDHAMSAVSGISGSFCAASAANQSRKGRQHWQLPEADMSGGANPNAEETLIAVGADSVSMSPVCDQPLAGAYEAICCPADNPASSKPGSHQLCSDHDQAASADAHEANTSLAVLRSVGQQVQGLLEALSRPAADSSGASLRHSSSAAGSAAGHCDEIMEEIADCTRQVAASHATSQCNPCSTLPSDNGDVAGTVVSVEQQVKETAGSPVASHHSASDLEATTAQLQQVAGCNHSVLNLDCLIQPLTDGTTTQQATMPDGAYLTREWDGISIGREELAHTAQVEKALQKLHKLRSTLQTIGVHDASSQPLVAIVDAQDPMVEASESVDITGAGGANASSDDMTVNNPVLSVNKLAIAAIAQHQQPQQQTMAEQFTPIHYEQSHHQAADVGDATQHSDSSLCMALPQQAATGQLLPSLRSSSCQSATVSPAHNTAYDEEQQQHCSHAATQGVAVEAPSLSVTTLSDQIKQPAAQQQPAAELQPSAQGHNRLQRALDGSDDVALLMSLSFKLDSLANKFRRQVLSTSLAPPVPEPLNLHSSHTSNRDSTSLMWTNVLDNSLYVPSPSRSSTSVAGPESFQDKHQMTVPLATDQLLDMFNETREHCVTIPACDKTQGHAQVELTDGQPLPEVQDAALQQVLHIDLQELLAGGELVQQQVAHAAEQLHRQLQEYSTQPPPFHGNCYKDACVLDEPAAVVAQPHLSGRMQSVLVMLMHEYHKAVRQQCRDMILRETLQEQNVPLGWWEESARIVAEQQINWFKQHHLPRIVESLHAMPMFGD